MSLRPGREPLRRGEAPLREADPDQRPRAARPRALHPLRPLHPLRQGGGRRPAHPLHRPGQPDRGQHLPRPPVRLVLQRQHRADLPGRRAHRRRPTGSRPARGTSTRSSPPAPRARSAAGSSSQSSRNQVLRYQGVDIDPVNWGWLCDKGRFDFEAVNSEDRLGAPLVRDRRRPGRGGLGRRRCGKAAERARATPAPSRRRRARRRPPHQRGRLRLGQAGQGRPRHRQRRRPARRRPAGRGRARPAPGHHRRASAPPAAPSCSLGPDLKEELPVLYLRLRHAVTRRRREGRRAAPRRHAVSELAAATLLHRPGARRAVVRALLAGAGGRRGRRRRRRGPGPGGRARWPPARSPCVLGRAVAGRVRRRPSSTPPPPARRRPPGRPLPLRRCAGPTSTAPSTWAWPRACCPAGSPSTTGGAWFADAGWADAAGDAAASTPPASSHAAADGEIDVLVLLGADPLADFPDRDLARRALAGARTVIAVDMFLTASRSQQADVVLPAAGFAEVDGTTTNIEGRVSRVTQKVTPPGTARADWMIAAELAHRLGADLGLESVERASGPRSSALAPSLRRHHRSTLLHSLERPRRRGRRRWPPSPRRPPTRSRSHRGRRADGPEHDAESDAGVTEDAVRPPPGRGGRRPPPSGPPPRPRRPRPRPRQPTPGRGRGGGRRVGAGADGRRAGRPGPPPPLLRRPPPSATAAAPAVDAYSLRLVATRKLYDPARSCQHSPSLAGLAPGAVLRLNPADFDRLGVAAGDRGARHRRSRAHAHARRPWPTPACRGARRRARSTSPAPTSADAHRRRPTPVTDVRVETAA